MNLFKNIKQIVMKKFLLLLLFTTFSGFAQQSFDQIISLTKEKKADLFSKINLIDTGYIPDGITFEDKKSINDLKLFLQNPFDTNISDFSLSKSIEKLNNIAIKVIPPVSSEMVIGSSGNKSKPVTIIPQFKDTAIEAFSGLPSVLPSGYSASTQIINALSQFLVDRTKQELTITFYDNFKDKMEKSINIDLGNGNFLKIELKDVFKNTYRLFESKNYFDTPSLGEIWILAFKKDLIQLPLSIKEVALRNEKLSKTEMVHFAIISYDAINKIKKGEHPINIIDELNEAYYINGKNKFEIDQVIGLLQLFSENLSTDEIKEGYKEIKWINPANLKALNEDQRKYLVGLIYQKGRDNGLFKKPFLDDSQTTIEAYININNYELLYTLIKRTLNNYSIVSQQLSDLKQNKIGAEKTLKDYANFINTFYSLFDNTIENYYLLTNNTQYYQSKYYTRCKPIFDDVISINNAIVDSQYAECLLLTNQFLNHLFPQISQDNEVYKKINFYGNFMVDVINTSENNGDLKSVIEKYAMPVSSYRIKRTVKSSWDVSAYPGLYLAYEFSNSNSFSYGITAPIGFSYSFKNFNDVGTNKQSSSSTFFLSVIDIGAPFSYRFKKDEAEGLPENIKWEQVFSPGFFYIYGFKNSPLSIGINAQFSPLLREIEENNVLDTKNIFRIGLTLLVDIPLFNLHSK
jgi:hypothetical protein